MSRSKHQGAIWNEPPRYFLALNPGLTLPFTPLCFCKSASKHSVKHQVPTASTSAYQAHKYFYLGCRSQHILTNSVLPERVILQSHLCRQVCYLIFWPNVIRQGFILALGCQLISSLFHFFKTLMK